MDTTLNTDVESSPNDTTDIAEETIEFLSNFYKHSDRYCLDHYHKIARTMPLRTMSYTRQLYDTYTKTSTADPYLWGAPSANDQP
jgi:hypothetical protein